MFPADRDRAPAGLVAYAVGHELTSPQWARSFAKGYCKANSLEGEGWICKQDELLPGDVAMFGSPDRWQLLQRAIAEGRTWYYGDHAYFGRREYYRITRNGYQLADLDGEGDAFRYDCLGLRLRDWKKQGGHILLCPNSPAYFKLHGLDCDEWVAQTSDTLRQHTDRDIRIRFKRSSGQFESDLRGAWAVVVYTSVCGVHAAMEGVASFATAPCASRAFGTGDLSLIERPVRPDNRYEMACVLAANQWTLHEIARGRAWRHLNEYQRVEGLDLSGNGNAPDRLDAANR